MALTVAGFGVVIVVLGAFGLAWPGRLQGWITGWNPGVRYAIAVGLRVMLGAALLASAGASRFPAAMRALGAVALAAAVVLALMGPSRLESLVQWWAKRSFTVIRVWCALALGFGAFLVHAVR